jgi:serine/threonine-protein kinase
LLLDEALDIAPARRAAWLAALAARDPEGARELRSLLARESRIEGSSFLEALPEIGTLTGAGAGAAPDEALVPGAAIGPYVLVSELGCGGMATVWLAERRDGIPRRRVALKLPHQHLLSGALRPRFERERDILASLSHPNVAPLFDAGVSDTGHPYLAMEWVEGLPITQYCREHRLPLDARLSLFAQVLDAVGYAHSHLVAHRDLKPSNILVTPAGQVKLLDFGIAKLLAGDADEAAPMTVASGPVATPDYAAPEQVAGEPVTAAVDLYALGVLLFELLTGLRPARGRSGLASPPAEPRLASQCVGEDEARCIGGLDAAQLRRALRGDLDAILAKALEADAGRRYGSAPALAEDLRRYRAHEPVTARRIGRMALAGKFVRRHRSVVALAAALMLALAAGGGAFAWQAWKARAATARAVQEEQRAEREASRDKAIREFLMDVFTASDPRQPADKPRGTLTAGELLQAGAERIQADLANDPDTQIDLLRVVTEIFSAINDDQRYQPLHRRYVQLLLEHYGERDPRTIRALVDDADSALDRGERAAAVQLLARTDRLIHAAGLDHSLLRAIWWVTRSDLLRGESQTSPERQAALEHAVSLYAQLGPAEEDYAGALSSLGGIAYRVGDDARAIGFYRRAIDVLRAAHGEGYGEFAPLYGNLAGAEAEAGDFDAALRDFQASIAVTLKTYGPGHGLYVTGVAEYARLLHRRGERQKADALFEQALAAARRRGHAPTEVFAAQMQAMIRENYGECLVAEGRPRLAVPLLQESIALYRAQPMYSEYKTAPAVHLALGDAYAGAGRGADAQREFAAQVAGLAATRPAADPLLLQAREGWGRTLLQRGDVRGARLQWQQVLEQGGDRAIAPVARAAADLARAALAAGDLPGALRFGEQATRAAEAARAEPDVRLLPEAWEARALALLGNGQGAAALPLAQRAYAALQRYDDAGSAALAEAARTVQRAQLAAAAGAADGAVGS